MTKEHCERMGIISGAQGEHSPSSYLAISPPLELWFSESPHLGALQRANPNTPLSVQLYFFTPGD